MTTDEKDVNTFPFHNLPPELKILEGISCSFYPFLYWIKEKSVATLAIRTFAIKHKTKLVLPPYYRTGDSAGDELKIEGLP